ncbi:MAG: bifunctional diaminohydroxyphosphoribosylaminopyrimidine deaminase/5-amino-6-(5-phosphoribosylamino)uracil reductase RibD [Desulfatiglandaceae bacterium]
MDLQEKRDSKFMREAIRMAEKGLGRTAPNPAVGAVIVRDGVAVSRGYHRKAGAPHAEVDALDKIGGRAEGATLYVTLEPCNHTGRTPPCTKAILDGGVERVVVGMEDPNPEVKGGGCSFLAANNIEVKTGVLEPECRRLNEAFVKYVTSNRPFMIVKSALTLDGWTATVEGDSKWITNERSRTFVHRLRDRVDAVMVGVGTILADDPQLTCRLKRGKGKDPLRIVVDTHLRTPLQARVLGLDSSAATLFVAGPEVNGKTVEEIENTGASVVVCPTGKAGIDMSALMDILGKRGITQVLVEGGAGIVGSLLREKLVDKFFIFKAPKLLGGGDGIPMAAGPGPRVMGKSLPLKDLKVRRFGNDILVECYPHYGAVP